MPKQGFDLLLWMTIHLNSLYTDQTTYRLRPACLNNRRIPIIELNNYCLRLVFIG
ncbi:hypothetical protein QWZ13_05055 [Reinekea marina]|uniref:hypothetical protein n=1 Tax=Reinekea marina TaxID=1310421 RepID=UPI0025B5D863|nr:hypothetical protein [Reinekea marina]MDN3648276.1 hypothetical protein [Reinekea marina]